MQLAIDVADFTPSEADQLRRAMGSKRSAERMQQDQVSVVRRHGGQRHLRRAGRRHLRQARRVRELRLPGEPRDELRLSRLRELVAQALPPGRVLRRAAQRAADGLLLDADARRRRPPARRHGRAPRHQRERRGRDTGKDAGNPRARRRRGRTTGAMGSRWAGGAARAQHRPHAVGFRRRGDRGGAGARRRVPRHG